jgi:hypothetical protein
MAIITCRECRMQVSDQAASCPRCGHPQREQSVQYTQPKAKQKSGMFQGFVVLCGLIIAGIYLANQMTGGGDATAAATPPTAAPGDATAATTPPTAAPGDATAAATPPTAAPATAAPATAAPTPPPAPAKVAMDNTPAIPNVGDVGIFLDDAPACPAKADIDVFITAYGNAKAIGDKVGESNASAAASEANCAMQSKGVTGLVISNYGIIPPYVEIRLDDGQAIWAEAEDVGDLSGPNHHPQPVQQ